MQELFIGSYGDVDLQQKDINSKGHFFINSGLQNLGIKGKTDKIARIFSCNTITIDFWGNAYYRPFNYKMATHNHVFSLSGNVIKNKRIGLYLCATMLYMRQIFSYDNMGTLQKIMKLSITLPVTTGGAIDYAFMEQYIYALETHYIQKLEKEHTNTFHYLSKITGIENIALTQEEVAVLKQFQTHTGKEWKTWKLKELFAIYSPKKRFYAINIKLGGTYPYVVRSSKNNGIKGYITEDARYLSPANTISFGQDTATMFYQERAYFTGDKIKVMQPLNIELNAKIACFLITCMQKTFQKFAWGQNSFNNDVLDNQNISLPVTADGEIDCAFMEMFITIQEKLIIKRITEKNNQIINTMKNVI